MLNINYSFIRCLVDCHLFIAFIVTIFLVAVLLLYFRKNRPITAHIKKLTDLRAGIALHSNAAQFINRISDIVFKTKFS